LLARRAGSESRLQATGFVLMRLIWLFGYADNQVKDREADRAELPLNQHRRTDDVLEVSARPQLPRAIGVQPVGVRIELRLRPDSSATPDPLGRPKQAM
jgi:hypothetical protein